LVELLVAVGLMALLLTMIATIFYEATQSFRMARASIEIHQNARAVLNALEKDLTAAEFSTYGTGVQGYFALTPGPVDPVTGACVPPPPGGTTPVPLAANGAPIPVDTLTFTTLAAQPGALYAAPEAVLQLALVRYALQWDGGTATFANAQGVRVARPTYTLVKRVRFPSTSNPSLNMGTQIGPPLAPTSNVASPNGTPWAPTSDAFNNEFVASLFPPPPYYYPNPVNQLTGEIILDPNSTWVEYAQAEPQAFKVLSMSIRLYCRAPVVNGTLQPLQVFTYGGFCTANGSATTLVDSANDVGSPPWRPNAYNGAWYIYNTTGGTWNTYTTNLGYPAGIPGYPAGIRLVAGTGLPATIFAVSSDTLGTTNTITIAPPNGSSGWTTQPQGPTPSTPGTQYQIIPYAIYQGVCTANGTATTLVDNTPGRPNASGLYVRISGGTGAPATIFPVISDDGITITINPPLGSPGWTTPPGVGPPPTQYQILPYMPVPMWVQRTNDPIFGTNPFLGMVNDPPALVEITLELTDQHATRSFSFTERFYIPASER